MTSFEPLRDQAVDRFWETLPPLWNFIRSHIRATATSNFDITVEQFHVLRYVRRGVTSMSDLAVAKNISRPAISQAVDVLVKNGLGCIGCAAAKFENIEAGARVHGLDPDKLIAEINEAIN